MYYKIVDIATNQILDIVTELKYIKFLSHGRIYPTDYQTAQGIVGTNETVYSFIKKPTRNVPIVVMQEISESEFTRLQGLVNSDGVITDPAALVDTVNDKVAELSASCKEAITNGFTIRLTDGKQYNFRLTAEDQLNLMRLEVQLFTGATSFVYHATNMPCRIFNREDMTKILRAFKIHTLYHTTYFNAAKQYLRTATTAEQISAFTYGMDVSNFVEDPKIKAVLTSGGVL